MWGSDGEHFDYIRQREDWQDVLSAEQPGGHFITMQGSAVFRWASFSMAKVGLEALDRAGRPIATHRLHPRAAAIGAWLQTWMRATADLARACGAAILEQGQPALIVDLHAVADACEGVVSPVTGPTRGRILLVDDSATLRARLAGELVQAGFEVDTADDGEQALARLDHGDFDAVVSDVQMPRLDGLQLLERIAGRLPVILATSYPEPEDEHRALCLGARAYLSKDDHTCREVVRILHLTLSTRAEPSP